jgi:hypothetical protein
MWPVHEDAGKSSVHGGNMRRTLITGLALAALVGCGGRGDQQRAAADSLQRDLQLAPADTTAALNDRPVEQPPAQAAPAPETPPAPAPVAAAPKPKPKPKPAAPAAPKPRDYTVAGGVAVVASATDSLHSRHNKVGEMFHATVGEDVKNDGGVVVIPAGSVVTFRVTKLEHANNKSEKDGKLVLQAEQVSIDGRDYPIAGTADQSTVEHTLQGQGVTAGGAARVGGGAAAGAILGKVIGGKTGAIVGGVAGGAAGAAAAVQTADRDVVVKPGAKVTFTLTSNFTITK